MSAVVSDSDTVKNLKAGLYSRYDIDHTKKGTSDVWRCFYRVKDTKTGKILPIALCKYCPREIQHDKRSSTSNLKRHACYIKLTKKRNCDTDAGEGPSPKLVKLDPAAKENVLQSCVYYVTKDLRSFKSVGCPGFMHVAETLVNIGINVGTTLGAAAEGAKVDIKDALPTDVTVSSEIKKEHSRELGSFVKELKPIVEAGHCSATSDLWTCPHTQDDYLSFTVHYLSSDWKLNSRILCTVHVPGFNIEGQPMTKSAEYITELLEKKLQDIGLPNTLSLFNYTTDQGSNLVKAFKSHKRINCAAHMLNNVLQTTFNEKTLKTNAPRILTLITKAKALVEYLKRTKKVDLKREKVTVVQECKTRWNTKLSMLQSIDKCYDKISSALKNCTPSESKRMEGIEKRLLSRLIVFLKAFKTFTKSIEAESVPTLHRVLPGYHVLLDHIDNKCLKKEYDTELIYLFNKAKECIKSKLKINRAHRIAAFLSPQFRQLRFLSSEEQAEVRSLVELEACPPSTSDVSSDNADDDGEQSEIDDQLEEIEHEEGEQSQQREEDQEGDEESLDEESLDENSSNEDSCDEDSSDEDADFYGGVKDTPQAQPSTSADFEAQKSRYEAMYYNEEKQTVLEFWKNAENEIPLLSDMAKKYLAWQASSASSERNFSTAGRLLEERRTNLHPSTVDSCLFLHSSDSSDLSDLSDL